MQSSFVDLSLKIMVWLACKPKKNNSINCEGRCLWKNDLKNTGACRHLRECSDPWKRAAFPTDDDDDAAAAAAAENGYGVPKFSDNNTTGIEEGADESKNWNSEASWFAIVAIIMAAGLAVGILLKKTSLLGGTRSEASHLLADLSSTTSGSSEMAAKFHVNLLGTDFSLGERSPG